MRRQHLGKSLIEFAKKNNVLIFFDMTAFSWKSPEPTPIAVPVPHSRLTVPAARLSFNNAGCNAAHAG